MEINPDSPIVKKLKDMADVDKNDRGLKDTVVLLFESSLIASGFMLEDPQAIAKRIFRMVKLGLGVDEDEIEAGPSTVADEMPPLEGAEEEASRMEEVD